MYEYPEVIKETMTTNGRHYYFNQTGLPSVTTIIKHSDTETQKAIKEWRKNVGDKEADRIVNRSLKYGNMMHDILNYHLTDKKEDFKQNMAYKVGKVMANNIIENYLNPNLNLWGSEVAVYFEGLYAGRIDCVGEYNGKPSIVDFKNAYKEKKEEHIVNYKVQCAAYALAHDNLFNTNIDQAVILIATPGNVNVSEFIVSGADFDKYKQIWLEYVENYYRNR